MGKKSKYPKYSTGSVSVNGKNVATVTKNKNGQISSSYNMSSAEKSLYNNVQQNLLSSLNNLNKFSASDKKLWNQQLDAYKRAGLEQINDIYTPMETSLKNDVANRFGNLDNSIFLNKLSDITNNKAKAVASLSDSLLMKQDELYSNELSNRMNYISLLEGLNSGMNNQILSYMNLAKSNSESGNNYNNRSYQSSNSGSFLGNMLSKASGAIVNKYLP